MRRKWPRCAIDVPGYRAVHLRSTRKAISRIVLTMAAGRELRFVHLPNRQKGPHACWPISRTNAETRKLGVALC